MDQWVRIGAVELECRKSYEGRACGDNCGCEVQVGSEVKRDLTADEALAPPRVICLLARRASESGSRSVATRKGAPRCLGGAAVMHTEPLPLSAIWGDVR